MCLETHGAMKVLAGYNKEKVTESWGNTCPQQILGPGKRDTTNNRKMGEAWVRC